MLLALTPEASQVVPRKTCFPLFVFFSEAHLVEIDVDFKGNDVKVSN